LFGVSLLFLLSSFYSRLAFDSFGCGVVTALTHLFGQGRIYAAEVPRLGALA
jgi:hypothetical protein